MTRTTDFFRDFANSLVRSLLRPQARKAGRTPRGRGADESTAGRATRRPSAELPAEPHTPGRSGRTATIEVDPASVRGLRMTYSPSIDGDPDPGEIVWTWVPYAEHDGRGKDRPVLVVAAEPSGSVLAVQLTSKSHTGDTDFIALGSGAWDAEGRPSWVAIDRVFRVHPEGMRREATALDERRFAKVKAALQVRYRWT